MRTPAELVSFIRIMCREQHTSLTKLEEKYAWANGTIGKWAKGAKYPPHDKLQKIAEELGCSTDFLLGIEVDDEYSAKFRGDLLASLEAHDPYDFDQDSIGDYLKFKALADKDSPLSLAEACEAAEYSGISLDDLIPGRSVALVNKDLSPKDGGLSEAELHLISLYRELNQEGQEKLLDLADDLVSSGKYIKSDSSKLGKAQGA